MEIIHATTVRAILMQLEDKYPGLSSYILDDQGALREHVNIFVNGEVVGDRATLTDAVSESDEIYVMQALSGG